MTRVLLVGVPVAALALLTGVALAHGPASGGAHSGMMGGMMGGGAMGGGGMMGRDPERSEQPDGSQLQSTVPVDDGSIPVAATVRLTAREWRFEPRTLTIPAGKPVRLILKDAGHIAHDVGVGGMRATILAVQHSDAMGSIDPAEAREIAEMAENGTVHIHLAPGNTASEVFQVNRPGTYRFACEIPGHVAAGMVGQIVVVP